MNSSFLFDAFDHGQIHVGIEAIILPPIRLYCAVFQLKIGFFQVKDPESVFHLLFILLHETHHQSDIWVDRLNCFGHLLEGYVEEGRVEKNHLEFVFKMVGILQVKVAEARQIFKPSVNIETSYSIAKLFVEGFCERGTTYETQLFLELFLIRPSHRECANIVLNGVFREKVLFKVSSFAEIVRHNRVVFFAFTH